MSGARQTKIVVADASILINLVHVDRLDLCSRLENLEFVVPEEVVAELTRPEQTDRLRRALEAGHLRRDVIGDPIELELYADLLRLVEKGEAACLAMAQSRGWIVASDERGRFLRLLRERLGERRILNTPGLFVLAIRAGHLTIEEADRLKETLERNRFRMKFASFRDVLDG